MILLFALLSLARADVVDDPPADCPPGSRGETAHSGTWCEAKTCTADSECAEGQVCREVALCVDTYERDCGGMQVTGEPPCTFTVHEALGECGADGTCARGTCQTALRCADPPGCGGCAGLGSAGGVPAAGLLWTLVPLVARRRARAG